MGKNPFDYRYQKLKNFEKTKSDQAPVTYHAYT